MVNDAITEAINEMMPAIEKYYEVSDRDGRRVDYDISKANEAVKYGFEKGLRLADVVQDFHSNDPYTVILRFEKREDE